VSAKNLLTNQKKFEFSKSQATIISSKLVTISLCNKTLDKDIDEWLET
jgi:hypothetical protein